MAVFTTQKIEALVHALTAGNNGYAHLIQLDADAVALAVRSTNTLVILLVHDPARATPGSVDARLGHVLRSERPEVVAGLGPGGLHLVLLDAPDAASAPAQSTSLARSITPYVLNDAGLSGGPNLLTDALAKAMETVASGGVVPTREALTAFERRGEDHIGQAGEERMFSRRIGTLRHAPVTIALGVILLGMFVLEAVWGGITNLTTLNRMGALVPYRATHGEPWRFLSSGYLHHGFEHLFGNVVTLGVCYYAEVVLAQSRFIVLFTLSVIGGMVGAALFGGPYVVTVGASGGIFGLAAATLMLTLREKRLLPGVAGASIQRQFLIMLGLNVAMSLRPGVSLGAHAGGAVVGAVLVLSRGVTWGLHRVWMSQPARPVAVRVFRVLAALCVVATFGSIALAFQHGHPWGGGEPTTFTRVSLAPLPVSLEVPSEIASALQPIPHTDGANEVLIGGAGDPLVIGVIAVKLGEEIPDSRMDEEIEGLREAMKRQGPPPKHRWLADPAVARVAGRPAVYFDQMLDIEGRGDVPVSRWQVLYPRYLISLEILAPVGSNKAWRDVAPRIARSMLLE